MERLAYGANAQQLAELFGVSIDAVMEKARNIAKNTHLPPDLQGSAAHFVDRKIVVHDQIRSLGTALMDEFQSSGEISLEPDNSILVTISHGLMEIASG